MARKAPTLKQKSVETVTEIPETLKQPSLTLADMTPNSNEIRQKPIAVDAMKPYDTQIRSIKRTVYQADNGSEIIREDIF